MKNGEKSVWFNSLQLLVFVVPGGCTSDCSGRGAATDGPDLPRADDAGIGVPGGPTVPGTSWVLISQKKIEFKHWTLKVHVF